MEALVSQLKQLVLENSHPNKLSFEIDNDPVYEVGPESYNFATEDSSSEDSADQIETEDSNRWFHDACQRIASEQQDGHMIDGDQLGKAILENLQTLHSAVDELQMVLVDLVGFEHLDFITDVITKKESLLKPSDSDTGSFSVSDPRIQAEFKRQNRLKAAERNANLAMAPMSDPIYPHVYRQNNKKSALEITNVRRVLPAGTIRESWPNYEHVLIPAQIQNTKFHPKHLLPISDLDEICQVTFSRYKTLNKMQTLIYPVCYESNENMLICAPTGAGKTDVALLAVLSKFKSIMDNVRQSSSDNAPDTDKDELSEGPPRPTVDCKVVYIAPLKALAAEITEKMGSRLAWMGVKVRELTGDMQLTRSEIAETHVLVTTPEKWDVVTRKPNDDSGLANQVQLLIIDEVHLLHEDRGAVLESIVARTRRQVEAQQRPIRIIGLSATLPNFTDVAEFLGVNLQKGLFYFDQSFRPVPLEQQFFGVRGPTNNPHLLNKNLDKVAYDECVRQLQKGHSVMIFVHSRRDTSKTAQSFMQMAQEDGRSDLFVGENASKFGREMRNFNQRGFHELFSGGFATHHAGMSRSERNMSEKLFAQGGVRVLVCTATLAWGVNLPAAVVIIKGTQVYNAQQGGFVDLGISDVIQIFGRAGRPQYEQTGTGILMTSVDRLDHYLDAITNQHPIESRFSRRLPENLNAEVALGTVATVNEGVQWLGYTYMFVRMCKAPQVYGLLPRDLEDDPLLVVTRRKLILNAVTSLRDTQMLVFDERDETESLIEKDIGRIASEYYLLQSTIEQFNSLVGPQTPEQKFIQLLSKGEDFSGLKVRTEETNELEKVNSTVPFSVDLSSAQGKTAVLLQAWISKVAMNDTALNSDMAYVAQNSARIVRAFFLLCISRGWADAAYAALLLDRSLLRRSWPEEKHPLFQIDDAPATVERRITSSRTDMVDLKTYTTKELGDLAHNHGYGPRLSQMIQRFPLPLILLAQASPLTSRVVRVSINATLTPPFKWDFKSHGSTLHFWLFVHGSTQLLHVEKMMLTSQNCKDIQRFEFAVPYIQGQRQVEIQLVSDSFLGAETVATLDFGKLELPTTQTIRTNLLRLRPLSVNAFDNNALISYYSKRFQHFNPMQSMVFHSLYHHKHAVLLGSPTGSGKTIACEIAVWAALRDRPSAKVVYIAPMKALVKERVSDWRRGICQVPFLPGNKKPSLVEMTGDTQPTGAEIKNASLIITTPEKFDGVSRHHNWALNDVALVVMDEVHLLASDRGAILEVIVSRLNRSDSPNKVRLLGMSTAVANAGDLANWLGVKSNLGLFNFPSSVRPVPLEMYIDGFPDVQGGFCPFMKSMNKPAYLAIRRHSPTKPALVFVPSRRQTRLTALDLISMSAGDENGQVKRWLHMSDYELERILEKVKDDTLKHTLQFGIAIHHAGLEYSDREISHQLFSQGKVQVLVATSTLAWGVNLPAYLVIVKGTQFFDATLNKYKDMDLTDVLQMMGRAGRPAFDSSGVAVVFTKQSTKQFYKYFLNLGFPVESSLHKRNVLENHLGAEISAGRITSLEDALEFITHTFLFKRVHSNPCYYVDDKPAEDNSAEEDASSDSDNDDSSECDEETRVNRWVVDRIDVAFSELQRSSCLTAQSSNYRLTPTPFLSISSFYYISHLTMRMFLEQIPDANNPLGVLRCLALASEYDELAIRHNEDLLNIELSKYIQYPGQVLNIRMVDPHVKAFVLVQARMRRLDMPVEDYIQDTITVLDQAIRILQALIDTAAQADLYDVIDSSIKVLRSIKQGVEPESSMLSILPGVKLQEDDKSPLLKNVDTSTSGKLHVPRRLQNQFAKAVRQLPHVKISDDGKHADIAPMTSPVWCPMFHKPQRESWFVIRRDNNGHVISVERIQRKMKISAQPGQTVLIMNDTVAIDYKLEA